MKSTPISPPTPTVIQPRVESLEVISRRLKFIYVRGGRLDLSLEQRVAAVSIWLRICDAKSIERLAFSTAVTACVGSVGLPCRKLLRRLRGVCLSGLEAADRLGEGGAEAWRRRWGRLRPHSRRRRCPPAPRPLMPPTPHSLAPSGPMPIAGMIISVGSGSRSTSAWTSYIAVTSAWYALDSEIRLVISVTG